MIASNKKKGIHVRHIGRYGEIVSVFVKYGFGDLLSRLKIESYIRLGRRFFPSKIQKEIQTVSKWDRIRMALEELGPTFIKLGQFASNRPDLLPPELITSLERLQDAVPSFDESQSVKIVEQELGHPISTIFKEFSHQPFASASIAQVHRAILHDGCEVAVKVQRPGISETINVDLEIMYHLAWLLEKHVQGMDVFTPTKFVEEFFNALHKEIDFTTEALHIDHFSSLFKDDPTVCVPKVYHDFTTRKIITTEFIHGIKISNIEELEKRGLDRKEIASRGAAIILKQIFTYGFFHADPHPGNILVKSNNVICFLDLGMTGILTPSSRQYLSSIIIGVVNQDPQRIAHTLYQTARSKIEHKEELEYEVAELIQDYGAKALGNINIGEVLNRLSKLLVKHRLRLIPGFYLLVKAVVTMEGIGYKLDPRFNMLNHLEPFARKLIQDQISPIKLAGQAFETANDYLTLLRDLPSDSRDVLQLMKSGQFRIEFEHTGLEPVLKKLDQVVNRLTYGLVLASLIVGSSIIVLSKAPPIIYGLPVVGIVGFVAAGLMGFWLLLSIIRHERF